MFVFNIDFWFISCEDFVDFGNAIDYLIKWFVLLLRKVGCEIDVIFEEWFSFQVLVNISFRDKDYVSLRGIMLTKVLYKDNFRNVFYFVEIMFVLFILVVQCERVFQYRIEQSSFYVGFDLFTLQDFIRIIVEGLLVFEFNVIFVVDKWFVRDRDVGERQRRLYIYRY